MLQYFPSSWIFKKKFYFDLFFTLHILTQICEIVKYSHTSVQESYRISLSKKFKNKKNLKWSIATYYASRLIILAHISNADCI